MKNLFKKRSKLFSSLTIVAALAFTCQSVVAQVKVGENPETINEGSVLEAESTNKGILLPRISLFNTNS